MWSHKKRDFNRKMAGLFAFISSKKLNYLDSEPTGYPELITQFLLLTIDSLSFPKLGSLLLKRVGLGGIRFNCMT